ncbi:nicotinate-nucleotide pyrophosphorylase [carboxylating] [Quadrisphaera granulorum]|uniref:Nicotinate-nucleotide pyrophosphorylase [carboxylating] n=1 Tax=Quadrisphaera granulorum TaxID=317664 RepID=A0A316A0Z8_9ACTN|nr:carboxylating nicotinate-nucleotide diphosphorylase [Quadrisphaera granulorum]PWJ51202.1 nicotinate-nucleotide pyrophosphorylase [carboxylating] [Quadrisphaera granulorum]SZE97852.1 nicotinate-nucleotide pyrophosphorylase [carboxylating] [Quadrisphaera granulorum]
MSGSIAGALADVVARALAEDAPWGDVTSESLLVGLPGGPATTTAVLRARQEGVLAGVGAFAEALAQASRLVGVADADGAGGDGPGGDGPGAVVVEVLAHDGDRIVPGQVLARAHGSALAVLRAERIALNLVQHLSGVATATAEHVALVAAAGGTARVVDTRKTTPGLRALERHAVRCGGGGNHRWSLSDAVLVKDNHLAVLAAAGGDADVTSALAAVRARVPHTTFVEVEVDRLDQLPAVLAAGVDGVLLDNFTLADLRAGVAAVREHERAGSHRVLVEASGGVRRETIGAIASTGVDLVSVGGLTQASAALDVGLDIGDDADVAPVRTRTG